MKILVLHPALTPYRVDFFNALAERVELHVVFLQENAKSQTFNTSQLKNLCHFDHEWLIDGFQVGSMYFRFGLDKLLRRFKPDIIISHEFLGVSLQILLFNLLNHKYLHVIWTAENPEIHSLHSLARKAAKWFFLQRIDGLIVYSKQMAWTYRSSLGYCKPVCIAPNIPNNRRFRELLSQAESQSRKISNTNDWNHLKIVLFVGRLSPEKSVDRLLKAWSRIESRFPGARIIIVGDGHLKNHLIGLAKALGISQSVLFLGKLDWLELTALYRLASLFCITIKI